MKNFLHSVVSSKKQRKLAITNDINTPGRYTVHDSLADELNFPLKGFETTANTDRVVYDCNRNNISDHPEIKRSSFRRKSWRRKSSSKKDRDKEEKTIQVAEHSKQKESEPVETITDGVKKGSSEISETNPTDKTKLNTHHRSYSECTGKEKVEKFRRNSSVDSPKDTPKTEKKKVRRFSTNTRKTSQTLFEDKTSSFEAIDFGGCYIANEMKSWTLIQNKLAAWSNRTNSPKLSSQQQNAKRNFSFSEAISEPAKNWMVNSLPTTLKRNRKKSYEFQRKPSSSASSNENLDEPDEQEEEKIQDVSLTREVIEPFFLSDFDVSFSSNVWYYGELHIKYDTSNTRKCSTDSNSSVERDDDQEMNKKIGALLEKEMLDRGTLIARIDKHGDVVYSITYQYEMTVYIGSIPFQNGKYCLDFGDSEQPRFSSIKFLLAYLIEENYLQRVTFAWLLQNCYSLLV